MSTNAPTARNAALALLSRINRWLVAAAVGVAGFLSLLAAHAVHGRTLPANRATASGTATSAPANSGGGLAPAAQPPASSAPVPSPVVSGGS